MFSYYFLNIFLKKKTYIEIVSGLEAKLKKLKKKLFFLLQINICLICFSLLQIN